MKKESPGRLLKEVCAVVALEEKISELSSISSKRVEFTINVVVARSDDVVANAFSSGEVVANCVVSAIMEAILKVFR